MKQLMETISCCVISTFARPCLHRIFSRFTVTMDTSVAWRMAKLLLEHLISLPALMPHSAHRLT